MQDIWKDENLVSALKQGSVVVMPTDTVYGIVGRAENKITVERIYKARNRNPDKPCIILIGDISDLGQFSVDLTEIQKNKIKEYWFLATSDKSRPTSIILDCLDEKLRYLHRDTKTLAFRLPNTEELRSLLIKTGPLIAPSANTEGGPISKNTNEAKKYFGESVDMYIDGGEIEGLVSKVIKLHKDGSVSILRE